MKFNMTMISLIEDQLFTNFGYNLIQNFDMTMVSLIIQSESLKFMLRVFMSLFIYLIITSSIQIIVISLFIMHYEPVG